MNFRIGYLLTLLWTASILHAGEPKAVYEKPLLKIQRVLDHFVRKKHYKTDFFKGFNSGENMKKMFIMFVTLFVLQDASCICAGEPKSLVQDILTNPDNRWKDLHLLPSQLIGSKILHNHPIVSFILNSVCVVGTLGGHRDLNELPRSKLIC